MGMAEIRKSIDRIDRQMVQLLNRRAKLAVDISHQKRRVNAPIFAPDRESLLLRRLDDLSRNGLLPASALRAIFREIISASLSLETRLTIAYFGAEGSFTHEAASGQFGAAANYQPVKNISDVFREVERGRADYGVVPRENSTEGAVLHTLDMFIESDVKICSEIAMPISQNLLSREGSLRAIKKIYTHPQPLGQCRAWLDGNLPEAEIVEASSTSQAARLAAKSRGAAAIASRLAARLYGLRVLARDIQDFDQNMTRFLVLGRHIAGPTGRDKTSLMLAIKDRVGALHRILVPFARHRLNLTSIESRPSRVRAWNYLFFIDCLGHVQDTRVKKALEELRPLTSTLKVLGSYPQGERS
jgi:chorismate mutase / prephenate dehydratase